VLARLAHLVVRRRWIVVGIWACLTLFGLFSVSQLSSRWLTEFSIPGYSAYEANQRSLQTFGNGEQAPMIAVFHSSGDITKNLGVAAAIKKAQDANPGSRVGDYYSTHSLAYVSKDGHTTFATIYPAGVPNFAALNYIKPTRAALKKAAAEAGVTVNLTGRDPIQDASSGGGGGPSVLTETMIGVLGALIILFFVFGTLPAVAMPLVVAIASILNTFTLVWILTYITNVSVVVEYLIALVGLGVAIDYALLMIFRFRDELREGEDVETAIVETMTHAGRSVIVSGSTVAVGLLSMVIIPLPFIRSIGVGGMLIPAVSVLTAITLLPALLSILGTRINRLRVMPKRLVDSGHPEDGPWGRWGEFVTNRPIPVALCGLAIVGALVYYGVQLNPSEAQAKDLPGAGDAIDGRQALANAGISAGVMKPFVVLAQNVPPALVPTFVKTIAQTPGVDGAAAPPAWRKGDTWMLEAFASTDGASKAVRGTISNLQHNVLPVLQNQAASEARGSPASAAPRVALGGVAAEDRDFVKAVYSNFPSVLAFVVLLTLILLSRAFRSLVLSAKAVVLNLVSLGAAYGIIVFIFQQGHGSKAIWNVAATQSIIPWIPIMIFAFLYGLSMDYEVFMLSRIREEYDLTGDTKHAISRGLARTGKLVTSAALVLMFAFLVLSSSPGVDIKQFGIGLAAGIIFDATVIRALLVPSLMMLFGRWNWYLPRWAARILFVEPSAAPPTVTPSPEPTSA
jgi:putative drug exporter of the RND superfamily